MVQKASTVRALRRANVFAAQKQCFCLKRLSAPNYLLARFGMKNLFFCCFLSIKSYKMTFMR
ncbi:hypothetical protein CG392_05960 [Gardnerella vaginalis]|nr:hypothetical protein CG392_05960 [Gardnerella vaginalis]